MTHQPLRDILCTVKDFNLATANLGSFYEWTLLADLYFGRFLFSEKKKKSTISDVALSILCMQVLHSDLQVIHGDFELFPT